MKKEAKNVIATFDVICQRLEAELDRIDANRMEEIEECLNGIISKMLETQNEVLFMNDKLLLHDTHQGITLFLFFLTLSLD